SAPRPGWPGPCGRRSARPRSGSCSSASARVRVSAWPSSSCWRGPRTRAWPRRCPPSPSRSATWSPASARWWSDCCTAPPAAGTSRWPCCSCCAPPNSPPACSRAARSSFPRSPRRLRRRPGIRHACRGPDNDNELSGARTRTLNSVSVPPHQARTAHEEHAVTLLECIKGPEDLKGLSQDQLTRLAGEIRDLLIETTVRTGGHLGPNLGVVELTIAIHRVFDSPKDKVVFDTGHQAYVHK